MTTSPDKDANHSADIICEKQSSGEHYSWMTCRDNIHQAGLIEETLIAKKLIRASSAFCRLIP